MRNEYNKNCEKAVGKKVSKREIEHEIIPLQIRAFTTTKSTAWRLYYLRKWIFDCYRKRSHEHRYASRKWIAPKRGLGPPLYLKYQRKYNKGKWAEEDLHVAVKESLPTIQIDTVPSPLSSPTELSPVSNESNEDIIDTNHIDIDIEDDQPSEPLSDDLRESLKSYIEDILSKAMAVAENKTKEEEANDEEKKENTIKMEKAVFEPEKVPKPEEKYSTESNEAEIRAAAEKVVEEVITKAQDTVTEQMEQFEKEVASLNFPITFDEAPDYVKDVASDIVKDIVGKAIAQVEEKAAPTTVPFNFEDVDLMKTNGPWYVRVREAFVRVLRTACFCTPRRNDS